MPTAFATHLGLGSRRARPGSAACYSDGPPPLASGIRADKHGIGRQVARPCRKGATGFTNGTPGFSDISRHELEAGAEYSGIVGFRARAAVAELTPATLAEPVR